MVYFNTCVTYNIYVACAKRNGGFTVCIMPKVYQSTSLIIVSISTRKITSSLNYRVLLKGIYLMRYFIVTVINYSNFIIQAFINFINNY